MTATPVCTVTAAGLSVPAFTDCLTYVQSVYRGIYGSDTYLGPDCQDGQFLAILALALSDANSMAASVYNAFSPSTAQGAGLSSVVKVNGIARKVATYSSVSGLVIGVAGTTVLNGVVSDGTYKWDLPATVVIPAAGQIAVTATCETLGAIPSPAGFINTGAGSGSIVTPTLGWQSFVTTADASLGAPVESDAALRIRQAASTELASQGILAGIVGNVLAISGVNSVQPYENTTDIPDANGLPGHSICLVVDGGDDATIAQTIALGKPCCSTYGSTQIPYTDAYGLTETISFQRRTGVPVSFQIGIKALAGFTAAIQAQVVAAIVAYVNSLGTGQSVLLGRVYVPANLNGSAISSTYEILYVYAARDSLPPTNADVAMGFAEYPTSAANLVQVILTS